jgi:hypothetical protein
VSQADRHDALSATAKLMLNEIFGYDHFCNEIVWSYRTGGRSTRHFARQRLASSQVQGLLPFAEPTG